MGQAQIFSFTFFGFLPRSTAFTSLLSPSDRLGSLSCSLNLTGELLSLQIMGQKAGALFINPKRFGSLHKPCMQEMIAFLSCMAANTSNSEACVQQKELLKACMESKSKKNRKSWGSINYQLQRLSRGRK